MKSHFIANISPCPTRQLACKSFTNLFDYFLLFSNKSLDDPESYFLYFVVERHKENNVRLLAGFQGTFSHKLAPCLRFLYTCLILSRLPKFLHELILDKS